MPPPTVSSQSAGLAEGETIGPFKMESAVMVAKWAVLLSIVVGVGLLIFAGVVTYNENKRVETSRNQWDEVYSALKALKEDSKPTDHIAALETVAPKVIGTNAHAYVLMRLGNIYFEEALKPEKFAEERAAALKKAIQLFEVVANSEPYKSNLAFGPLAVENLALAYEQSKDYKKAIEILDNALTSGTLDAHYLYHEMLAHEGRLYWLKSEEKKQQANAAVKDEDKKKLNEEIQQDRKMAGAKLAEALRSSAVKQSEWRKDAEYIASMVNDKPGSALPDGKIPAPKPPKGMTLPGGVPGAPKMNFQSPNINFAPNGVSPIPAAPVKVEADAKPADKAVTTPAVPVVPEIKKDVKPADKTDKTEKKDKSSSLPQEADDLAQIDASTSPSGHLTFAQMQQLLKSGKPVFCQCPRCATGQKSPSAKLVE